MGYRQCNRRRVGFSTQISELPHLHDCNSSVFIILYKLYTVVLLAH